MMCLFCCCFRHIHTYNVFNIIMCCMVCMYVISNDEATDFVAPSCNNSPLLNISLEGHHLLFYHLACTNLSCAKPGILRRGILCYCTLYMIVCVVI